jgi:hypothetical protein
MLAMFWETVPFGSGLGCQHFGAEFCFMFIVEVIGVGYARVT